ncbi:MAG: 50S ribosomal protein L21e [Candidatus Hadarchaeales archaeon]
MARRSKGLRSKSRRKLTKYPRERGLHPPSRSVREFPVGARVTIMINPAVIKGQPHHRYHGRTAVVTGRRGRAYLVSLRDGEKEKIIISRPEHLRMVSA